MKICYVCTMPLTIRAFFIPQLKYLAENGFDVTVVCSDDGLIGSELGENIHFYGVDIPRGLSLFGSVKAISRLTSFFKKEKFDLIQYSTPNASFYSAIASKKAGCMLRNYHLMGYRYLGARGIGRAILKTIEKITCSLSTTIECVSKSNLKLGIEEKIFDKEKATVVWNGSSGGVDIKRFDYGKRDLWRNEMRQEIGYSADNFVFGFVGRITRDKGINELLEAFFRLDDNSKLFIIGRKEDDTVDRELWNKAINSKDVIIHAPSVQIEKYYAMIDVLVLPSYREGFGNVIIEAAAMGTPAIVSRIPGPVDAVCENKTAVFADVKSVESLIGAMKRIESDNYCLLGEQAKQYVQQNFDSEKLCEKILIRKENLFKNSEVC